MEPDDVRALLVSESPRVEWKQTEDAHAVKEAVCALANDLEDSRRIGYLVLGANKHGAPVGVEVGARTLDEVQQRLAAWLRGIELQPTPSTSIEPVALDGRQLFVICVEPYPVPPMVTLRSVPYVRVGTSTRRATEADQQRLRERRPEHVRPFDVRAVRGAGLEDLDVVRLKDQLEAQRIEDEDAASFPPLETWLASRDLGQVHQEGFVPNVSAVLIYGVDPQAWLPGARVDLVRYAGTDVDAPIALRESFLGTVPDQLDGLWRLLRTSVVELPEAKAEIRERFTPEYPTVALEELVRNLVQHRAYDVTHAPARIEWFDDRIEMTNPGGPFGHASQGRFGDLSDYRNPSLTRILSDLGYVQRLGRGVRRVRLALAQAGHPDLEVETNGFTRVIVRRRV